MTRVLVTGATGFVGRILCKALVQSGYLVRVALRSEDSVRLCVGEHVTVGDIATADWSVALKGVESVIHCAARAHILHDSNRNADLYMETNAGATLRLANAASHAGVRRFVYMSSIKVNGEKTADRPYSAADEPDPQDAYGASKLLGERNVMLVAARGHMEVTIVRSPLVYGPGVRANFLRLLRWVDKGWPLPLGAIRNTRSLVSIWNLCDLLVELLKHPMAAGRTWMVSDGKDLSTPDLIRCIGAAMGRRVHLLPVPVALLRLCGRLVGRAAEIERLCGSLVVDITQTRRELGWSPQVSIDEALARTVDWYLSEGREA
jgi:UDP-4-keto-D-QuiNAc 4-reductase